MRILSTGFLLLTGLSLVVAPAQAQKRQRDLITRAEILKLEGVQTAYDVVRRIHPEWLRVSGVRSVRGTSDPVQVYLNDRLAGGPGELSSVDIATIGEIRHMDGAEAEAHYGQNHSSGAILVVPLSAIRKDSVPPVKPPGSPQSR